MSLGMGLAHLDVLWPGVGTAAWGSLCPMPTQPRVHPHAQPDHPAACTHPELPQDKHCPSRHCQLPPARPCRPVCCPCSALCHPTHPCARLPHCTPCSGSSAHPTPVYPTPPHSAALAPRDTVRPAEPGAALPQPPVLHCPAALGDPDFWAGGTLGRAMGSALGAAARLLGRSLWSVVSPVCST